ncbi:MAG: WG repeat-containing protein [Flavobacteriales bacterium]|nr:WG repeat-containing protein [Flavobacteriales bacterium]
MKRYTIIIFLIIQNLSFGQSAIYKQIDLNKYGLTNNINEKITEPIYTYLRPLFTIESSYFYFKKGEVSGILNSLGEEIIFDKMGFPTQYLNNDIALYRDTGGTIFYNLKLKKKLCSIDYNKVISSIEFIKNNTFFRIPETDYLINSTSGEIESFSKVQKKNNSAKLIEKEDIRILKEYDDNFKKENWILPISFNKRLSESIFNSDPEVSIKKLTYFNESSHNTKYLLGIILSKNDSIGFANNKGQIVVDCEYKDIKMEVYNNNIFLILVNKQNKFGLYNVSENKELLEPIYDKIFFDDGFKVIKNNYEGTYKDNILYLPE